jgi:hypothetical protein
LFFPDIKNTFGIIFDCRGVLDSILGDKACEDKVGILEAALFWGCGGAFVGFVRGETTVVFFVQVFQLFVVRLHQQLASLLLML